MAYLNKLSSLQDVALSQVAINLCQSNGFKEVALCLEKPTYGVFIDDYDSSLFVCDPEKLSALAKMKEAHVKKNDPSFLAFIRSCCMTDKEKVKRWDEAVDKECQTLTEGLPRTLKHGVYAWMNRIAWEYLSYTRKQEVLFGVSRYFWMNFLTPGDWTEDRRLDEKKLVERLLEDERLTVIQKYRIACVYCLHVNIHRFWDRLTEEEKQSISGDDTPNLSQESHSLVLLWSYQMDGNREEIVTREKIDPWIYAAQQAICYGNQVAVMACWEWLKEQRQTIVIDMALLSVKTWKSIPKILDDCNNFRVTLVSNKLPRFQSDDYIRYFNVPYYYGELMRFFFSQMVAEQQLEFFIQKFQERYCDSVLGCFLDWPHQDHFIPMIKRLWVILPQVTYTTFLLTLASKYSGNDEKENGYCDYRNLLWTLWEETPDEYKRHVFLYNEPYGSNGRALLRRLIKRAPFEAEDEDLFKLFFANALQEERRDLMHSIEGQYICSVLTRTEMWSFANWLIEECLPKEEIPSFKKEFIESYEISNSCLDNLEEDREKVVDDLIDWAFELVTDKTQFKWELVNKYECLGLCGCLLGKGEFSKVERIINFCVSSGEMKNVCKVRFAKRACGHLLKNWAWEQMNEILDWSVDTEEKITGIKMDLFSNHGIDTHYMLLFIKRQLEEVERFYSWFGLSPEEIEKLKTETVFSPKVLDHVYRELCHYPKELVKALQWCLPDEEILCIFKDEIEERYFKQVLGKIQINRKIMLDCLLSELLLGCHVNTVL